MASVPGGAASPPLELVPPNGVDGAVVEAGTAGPQATHVLARPPRSGQGVARLHVICPASAAGATARAAPPGLARPRVGRAASAALLCARRRRRARRPHGRVEQVPSLPPARRWWRQQCLLRPGRKLLLGRLPPARGRTRAAGVRDGPRGRPAFAGRGAVRALPAACARRREAAMARGGTWQRSVGRANLHAAALPRMVHR